MTAHDTTCEFVLFRGELQVLHHARQLVCRPRELAAVMPRRAAADNVAFVRAHRTAVDDLLKELAIEIR